MKYKRFLAAVLSVFMMLPISVAKADAESSRVVRTVVYETKEDKAVCYLKGLGIDVSFEPQEEITRGLFTSLVMQLAYNEDYIPDSEKIYEDVNNECEYFKDISFAYNRGIISKSGIFRPYDAITYQEAMTIATVVLGYKFLANDNGGYPYGYIKCASNIGLNKNISKALNDKLSGNDVLLILYNMLNADFMMAEISGGGISYSIKRKSTILTERYELKKIEGIVTSTVYSDLSGNSSVNENHIKINGQLFEFYGDSYELLGMQVEGYVNKDNIVTIICPCNNKILEFDDIESYDSFALKYHDGNITKKAKLDKSFCFLYNGVAYNSYTQSDFTRLEGYVKLIDNNGDGIYDVVYAYDVEYMYVTKIDILEKNIYGQSVLRDYINYGEESHIIFHKMDDAEYEISPFDIEVENVLAVMLSKDGKCGKVVVINNEITGTIEQIDNDYIKINGTDYKRSRYFNTYYSPKAGITGTCKVGILNDIVIFTLDEDREYHYGYLVEAEKQRKPDTFVLKLFTENGEFEQYECEEKILLDGTKINTEKKWATNMIPLTDLSNIVRRQLIRYKLKDGRISAIDTAKDATSFKDTLNNSNDCLLRYYKELSTYFKSDGMNTFLRFNITAGTIIFTVPALAEMSTDEKDYDLTNMSALRKDGAYTVDAYDFDENGVPKIILIYESVTSGISDSSDYGVIDKVVDAWSEDLGICKEVSIWKKGECLIYYIEGENKDIALKSDGKQIRTGDVVRFTQKNGTIKELKVDFDAETKSFTSAGNSLIKYDLSFNQIRSYAQASIYRTFDNKCIVSWTKTGSNWDYTLPNLRMIPLTRDVNIIVVENRRIYTIYPDEILDYYSSGNAADEVLLIQAYWYGTDIVIYRD